MNWINKPSANLALLVIIAFLTTITFSPALTSCGGGGGGGGGDDEEEANGTGDGGENMTFGTVQTGTTDENGAVTITSANVGKQIQLTTQNTAGRVISGLSVEYVDTADGSAGQLIVSDPNRVYQTAIITLDSDDLSTSVSRNMLKAQTLSDEEVRAFIITTATLVTIALTMLMAKAVYEIGTGIYELYGDPPTVSLLGDSVYSCISTDQILTTLNIGINAFGLLTAGSVSGAADAVREGTKTAFEVVGSEAAPDVIVTVGTAFSQHLSNHFGYDPAKKYCLLLVGDTTGSERYSSAGDLIAQECSDASECSGETTAEAENKRDRDLDGYTTEGGDCDDGNPLNNPAMIEVCGDGIDQDCNGSDSACYGNITVDIASPPFSDPNDGVIEGTDCPAENWENGICTGTERALYTMAGVTDANISFVYIIVNGRAVKAKTDDMGDQLFTSSESPAMLKCDADISGGWVNQIAVVAVDSSGNMAVQEIARGCKAEASDLLVALTWDTCNTDLDLYVKEPDNTIRYDDANYDADSETASDGVVYGFNRDCYGVVYYAILEGAPAGLYQMRVHHRTGTAITSATMTIMTDEGFDLPYTTTETLGAANASKGGTGNFTSTDPSWGTTVILTKTSGGYWLCGS